MKCPSCDFPLTEPVQRTYDRVRIVGARPLLGGESLSCFRCRRTIAVAHHDREYAPEDSRVIVLGNEGGIVFACQECGHRELKDALGKVKS